MMKTLLRPAITLFLVLTLLTGVLYPLLVTVIAQIAFSHQANGSLITRNGTTVGSALIGQNFDIPKYFWGRLSATSPSYNAGASSGSNYGPLNTDLAKAAKSRLDALKKADPENVAPVPVDLVTASGSGLDPHISIAAANYQVARVARVRGLNVNQVQDLATQSAESRTFGILGEPRVNVLKLNLALDKVR
jgi:K+-transporting ATPase ATPase C chain